jgi:site-specific DNA-cytosine methylase
MRALLIDAYAGGLVLGVRAAGIPIRGSYGEEPFGKSAQPFGMNAQRLNFPEITGFRETWPWDDEDLGETVVLSNPPCSVFSRQTQGATNKGVKSPKFRSHRRIMEYALGNHCAALAIESVEDALKAADEYAAYATKYRYFHFFVKLNAASFGIPQWRPRLWVVFFRSSDVGRLVLTHEPVVRKIGSILQPLSEARVHPSTERDWIRIVKKFPVGFKWGEWRVHESVGAFAPTVAEFLKIKSNRAAINQACGTKHTYGTDLPHKLDPHGFAPVLLANSLWLANGRLLSRIEYQRSMGFPDDWKWPASLEKDFREYLSKGVAPPVGTWIAQQMIANLEGTISQPDFTVGPGEVCAIPAPSKPIVELLEDEEAA